MNLALTNLALRNPNAAPCGAATKPGFSMESPP
jgi:hypothetical protein